MRSPYSVLGVGKDARAEDIKSAYRRLAKTWHPDQKRDDPAAGVRFAEIAQAYQLLIDPETRLRFDQGEIDARGRRKARPARTSGVNPFKGFRKSRSAGADENTASADTKTKTEQAQAPDEASFEDMIVHIFGEAAAKQSRQDDAKAKSENKRSKADAPGLDDDPLAQLDELFARWKMRHKHQSQPQSQPQSQLPATRSQIEITLEAALAGYNGEIAFGDAQSVSFSAPPGTLDGAELTVPSPDPSAYGDAIVTFRHAPHARLRSAGADLHGEHAISLSEAVLGGSFVFTALDGPVRITIPEWSGSDTVLRVAGMGLPTDKGKRGALHVHLRVMLPEKPDPRLIELMRDNKRSWFM